MFFFYSKKIIRAAIEPTYVFNLNEDYRLLLPPTIFVIKIDHDKKLEKSNIFRKKIILIICRIDLKFVEKYRLIMKNRYIFLFGKNTKNK